MHNFRVGDYTSGTIKFLLFLPNADRSLRTHQAKSK
jgi:hypothetical protein